MSNKLPRAIGDSTIVEETIDPNWALKSVAEEAHRATPACAFIEMCRGVRKAQDSVVPSPLVPMQNPFANVCNNIADVAVAAVKFLSAARSMSCDDIVAEAFKKPAASHSFDRKETVRAVTDVTTQFVNTYRNTEGANPTADLTEQRIALAQKVLAASVAFLSYPKVAKQLDVSARFANLASSNATPSKVDITELASIPTYDATSKTHIQWKPSNVPGN